MFEFHGDRRRYFDIQVLNAGQYVIPFIEETFTITAGMRVLEIGCGEGGVLKAFINRGCTGVGVELAPERVANGELWLKEDIEKGYIRFVIKDIYQTDVANDLDGSFDIIVLKDVIEHIHDQPRLIGWMKTFLKPGGTIFFGFPPWQMPFGGHQQMCRNKWLSKLPWYHLLPRFAYKALLNASKEDAAAFLEIKDTGISIERFEHIVKQQGYKISHKTFYLLNPIYKWKFGREPIKQLPVLKSIPWVRNFFTTCVYYLISAN